MKKAFPLRYIALIPAAILVVSFFVYVFWPSVPEKLSTVDSVRANNEEFVEGYMALTERSYAQAAALFEEALKGAEDTRQEAYIKMYAGYAKGLSGDYAGGVAVLKSVADNQLYADTYRAYAVELMGELYYKNGRDPMIAGIIFSNEPYKSYLKDGNIEKAFMGLYGYAKTIFSTGTAGYRLAILNLYNDSPTTDQEIEGAIQAIRNELTFLTPANSGNLFVADRLLKLGYLEGLKAVRMGGDMSEAETSFREALDLSAPGSNERISAGYFYALTLSQVSGESKNEDIATLLQPFFDPAYANTEFYRFFSEKRNQEDERIAIGVRDIARHEPRFESLVRSLGWKL